VGPADAVDLVIAALGCCTFWWWGSSWGFPEWDLWDG